MECTEKQYSTDKGKNGKNEKNDIYKKERKCCICMVSDFFYPNLGGIETHIFELSKHLIKKGFKVIVVTHCYNNRNGVRWMGNGIKVYYLPLETYMDVVTFPNIIGTLPLCRNILYREKVDIVHGHQATSCLAHQFILHAKSLGLKTIYTDHSLYSFSDKGCIHVNKLLKYCINDVDHIICVSHTNRENLVLRTEINPYKTSVIGNALDTKKFIPCINKRPKYPRINIIVISRLTYRKGIDLIVKVIPLICKKYPFIKFIIGGNGPKRVLLEEMREKYHLHNSVVLLGKVKQNKVKNVLQTGHIFLNASLTEAFCIAIIEAASCGLLVISTDVGGISEVLPHDMMILSKPNHIDLCKAVDIALDMVKDVDSNAFHERVADKTEKVYMDVLSYANNTILSRIRKIYNINTVFSKVYIILIMLSYIYCQLLEWLKPRKDIEEVVSFPHLIEEE
ncbi:phosphatidylinositol N-acetylglucosaminyltransferase subunit A, putative [Plasmodium malariae]|uniref:phosphatidylinositol N-acetylglucosaminyltransferase n=1 Tax=Plasmodium malariae TaxID=5858 RepID=A0A1C3KE66_PLAMA|nr:phosphatidylinositol N-acetylglucosaminyltransferase subunit A, putative [Plasmodium malariae]